MMNSSDMDKNIKKRLMFIKGEDYYFITYNLLLLLNELKCWSNNGSVFKDIRKLSFLIEFIADENLIAILEKYEDKSDLSRFDKERLNKAYSNGLLRLESMNRLLFSLEKKNIVELSQNSSRTAIDITLNNNPSVKRFIREDLFELEKNNAKRLRSTIGYLTRLTLENMLIKLFSNYGISTWPI